MVPRPLPLFRLSLLLLLLLFLLLLLPLVLLLLLLFISQRRCPLISAIVFEGHEDDVLERLDHREEGRVARIKRNLEPLRPVLQSRLHETPPPDQIDGELGAALVREEMRGDVAADGPAVAPHRPLHGGLVALEDQAGVVLQADEPHPDEGAGQRLDGVGRREDGVAQVLGVGQERLREHRVHRLQAEERVDHGREQARVHRRRDHPVLGAAGVDGPERRPRLAPAQQPRRAEHPRQPPQRRVPRPHRVRQVLGPRLR